MYLANASGNLKKPISDIEQLIGKKSNEITPKLQDTAETELKKLEKDFKEMFKQ